MDKEKDGTMEHNGGDSEKRISLRGILTQLYEKEYEFEGMSKEEIDAKVQECNEIAKQKDRVPSLENYIDERSEWFIKFMDIIIESGAANKLKDRNGRFRFVKDGQVQWMIEAIIDENHGGYGSIRKLFKLEKKESDVHKEDPGNTVYEALHKKKIRSIVSQENQYYEIGADEVEALRDFVEIAYTEAGCEEEEINSMVAKFDSNFPIAYFNAEEHIREIVKELVECRKQKSHKRLEAIAEICEKAFSEIYALKYR